LHTIPVAVAIQIVGVAWMAPSAALVRGKALQDAQVVGHGEQCDARPFRHVLDGLHGCCLTNCCTLVDADN